MADLQILQLLGIGLVFVLIILSMLYKKLPTMIALPLLAVLVSLIGGVSPGDLVEHVVGDGVLRLYKAYTIVMFGGMLSVLLQKTGIAEGFIKMGAELAGDRREIIGFVLVVFTALLFTTLNGLGAIIMLGTIILPILGSLGFNGLTVAALFLMGINMGGVLNPANWALYMNVLNLDQTTICNFALIVFVIDMMACIVLLVIDTGMVRKIKIKLKYILSLLLFLSGVLVFFKWVLPHVNTSFISRMYSAFKYFLNVFFILFVGVVFLLALFDFVKNFVGRKAGGSAVKWYAYLTPLLPLIFILAYRLPFLAAFIIAIVFGYISTYKKGNLRILMSAIIEGASGVMPAVILMMGIGMLLTAIMGPENSASYSSEWPVVLLLRPYISRIIPSEPFSYILTFAIMTPLVLYRGPLNVWGMGYGLAGVIMASGALPASAIMGMLIAVGQVQGVCDPTNTHNIWIANEIGVDVQNILWKTLPYMWLVALAGLIVSAIIYL